MTSVVWSIFFSCSPIFQWDPHFEYFFKCRLKTPLRWRFCHSSRDTTGQLSSDPQLRTAPLCSPWSLTPSEEPQKQSRGKCMGNTSWPSFYCRGAREKIDGILRVSKIFISVLTLKIDFLSSQFLRPFLWAYMVFFLPCPTRHRPSTSCFGCHNCILSQRGFTSLLATPTSKQSLFWDSVGLNSKVCFLLKLNQQWTFMEWMKLNRLGCLQLPKKSWGEMSFAVNPRRPGGAPRGGLHVGRASQISKIHAREWNEVSVRGEIWGACFYDYIPSSRCDMNWVESWKCSLNCTTILKAEAQLCSDPKYNYTNCSRSVKGCNHHNS